MSVLGTIISDATSALGVSGTGTSAPDSNPKATPSAQQLSNTTTLQPYGQDLMFSWASLPLQNYIASALGTTGTAVNYGYSMYILKVDGDTQTIIRSFDFPINPQSVSISVPATISLTVTQKGIVEEHNAAPLHKISLGGTMGIIPTAVRAKSSTSSQSALDYIFKDTIKNLNRTVGAAGNVLSDISKVVSGAGNSDLIATSKLLGSETDPTFYKRTAFYNINALTQLLDFYLAIKRTGQGANYRLGVAMNKDQRYYYCTLNGYQTDKRAGSLEYNYSINLTAWKRLEKPFEDSTWTGTYQNTTGQALAGIGLNNITAALAAIQDARTTVADFKGVIAGVTNDVDRMLFTPIREVSLLCNEILGAANSLYDLADTFTDPNKRDAYFSASLSTRLPNASDYTTPSVLNSNSSSAFNTPNKSGTTADVGVALGNESQTGANNIDPTNANPGSSGTPVADALFADPEASIAILSAIGIDEIPLTTQAQAAVEASLNYARNLQVSDLQKNYDSIEGVMNDVSNFFGGGDATYRALKGLNPPKKNHIIDIQTIILLKSLADILRATNDVVLALKQARKTTTTSYLQYFSDAITAAGGTFNMPQSRFYVPMPAQVSLEQVALLYLGDPSRWTEIAALNGLRAPYIDETGITVPLLSSGVQNTVTVADGQPYYVGQVVRISSELESTSTRKIEGVETLNAAETVLTLSGDNDLGVFKLADGATIQYFLPDTVNSGMLIAIPSASSAPGLSSVINTPTQADMTAIDKIAGADLLLNSQGDIVFTASDIQLSTGLTNLIQASNIKLLTLQGQILGKSYFGNPAQAGQSIADFSADQIKSQLSDMFKRDPRFTGLQAGRVTIAGPLAKIEAAVGIQGVSKLLPVSVEVPRS